ncbi:YggL 50S ribosome-binding family protein [Pseudomonas profundi]|uniref:YggL 50S ribosome-binding family protein n=1 Tax=Pseudomonas profundi TaxID=1981513 RepID=UPI00123B1641|nr:YggL family protein [Pseudomonas profundi]
MTSQRSRRLRKKMRVDEFQELGFNFTATPKQALTDEQADALIDALIEEVISPRGLEFGGWVGGGFVCKAGRGSATEEDRDAVVSWLRQRPEIETAEAEPLVDAWH